MSCICFASLLCVQFVINVQTHIHNLLNLASRFKDCSFLLEILEGYLYAVVNIHLYTVHILPQFSVRKIH
jgi:hypothetical protein